MKNLDLDLLRMESEHWIEENDPHHAKIAETVIQLIDEIGRLRKALREIAEGEEPHEIIAYNALEEE